jgi:hypothetical protein
MACKNFEVLKLNHSKLNEGIFLTVPFVKIVYKVCLKSKATKRMA